MKPFILSLLFLLPPHAPSYAECVCGHHAPDPGPGGSSFVSTIRECGSGCKRDTCVWHPERYCSLYDNDVTVSCEGPSDQLECLDGHRCVQFASELWPGEKGCAKREYYRVCGHRCHSEVRCVQDAGRSCIVTEEVATCTE